MNETEKNVGNKELIDLFLNLAKGIESEREREAESEETKQKSIDRMFVVRLF